MINLYGSDLIGRIDVSWNYSTRTDARKYYVKDHLGSIRQTLNESGTVTMAMDYYAFGATRNSYVLGGSVDKYKFTSKERDSETGLDYFGARYYDSKIGRWMSVDPLAEKYPGWSPYNYTMNNPLNLIDPDGRDLDYPDPIGDAIHSAEINYVQAKISLDNFMDEHHSDIASGLGLGAAFLGGPVGLGLGAGIGLLDAQYSYSQGDNVGGTVGLITTSITAGLDMGPVGTAAFTAIGNEVAKSINGKYNVSGKNSFNPVVAATTAVKPSAKAKGVKKQDSGKKKETAKKSTSTKEKEEKNKNN